MMVSEMVLLACSKTSVCMFVKDMMDDDLWWCACVD